MSRRQTLVNRCVVPTVVLSLWFILCRVCTCAVCMGCMARLTLAIVCMAAADHPVVTQWEVWVRGGGTSDWPQNDRWPYHIQNYVSIKEVYVLVSGFFVFLSAVFPRFSSVWDPRGRLGGKMGNVCEEFEDNWGWYIGVTFLQVLVQAYLRLLLYCMVPFALSSIIVACFWVGWWLFSDLCCCSGQRGFCFASVVMAAYSSGLV